MKTYNPFLYLLVITLTWKELNGFSATNSLRDFEIEVKANEYVSVEDIEEVKAAPFVDFTRITDRVFMTSVGGINGSNLIKYKIRCIFDLARELNYTLPHHTGISHFEYKTVKESEKDNIASLFDNILPRMKACVKKRKNTVVHCFGGVGRSGAIVTAYLIKHRNMSLKEAFIHIKSLRIYRPNNGFMKQLIVYEKKIRGNASVKFVPLERDGLHIEVPDFFETKYPEFVDADFEKVRKEKLAQ